MKTLVIIAHYFKPDKNSSYSSTTDGAQERRKKALEEVLLCWCGHFGKAVSMNIRGRRFDALPPAAHDNDVDLLVITTGEDHLMNAEASLRYDARWLSVWVENPMLLPFAAHRIMAENADNYDWFVYSEDDIAVRDPLFFAKLRLFNEKFGPKRVLMPNRYEANNLGMAYKTYVDGDLEPRATAPFKAMVKEENELVTHATDLLPVTCARAANPHSGFFAITGEQMRIWKKQPHFMDMDCSFVSPLESAATLGILKTFALFKPVSPMSYLEVEHLDAKFSKTRFR